MAQIIARYLNGGTRVTIYENGTKERETLNAEPAIHPESIDVKISNYCDAGCSYCHEQSTKDGKHGDLASLLEVLSCLPAGVEIAIGGGNPLSHPDLINFLAALKKQGLIANITINQVHLREYKDLILDLIKKELVYGVGISYSSSAYLEDIRPILRETNNLVFHVIMGISQLSVVEELFSFCKEEGKLCKILILGYKEFGFGLNYYLKNKRIEEIKYQWYIRLASFFKREGLILSFDNLAISQLKLSRFFTKEAWQKFYMGDDGTFTCYIDGVSQNYAKSSTSTERVSFKNANLLEFFKNLLGKAQRS